MSSNYVVNASYVTDAQSRVVEFPDSKTWDDVAEYYVKWDTLYVLFKGEETWREFELHSDSMDGTDWRRPLSLGIWATNEDGEIDYDSNPVAEED